jgi:hypothetical protein
VLLGASSVQQLRANLASCAAGPLPPAVVAAYDSSCAYPFFVPQPDASESSMLSSIEALLLLVRSTQQTRSPLRTILVNPTHLNPDSPHAIEISSPTP